MRMCNSESTARLWQEGAGLILSWLCPFSSRVFSNHLLIHISFCVGDKRKRLVIWLVDRNVLLIKTWKEENRCVSRLCKGNWWMSMWDKTESREKSINKMLGNGFLINRLGNCFFCQFGGWERQDPRTYVYIWSLSRYQLSVCKLSWLKKRHTLNGLILLWLFPSCITVSLFIFWAAGTNCDFVIGAWTCNWWFLLFVWGWRCWSPFNKTWGITCETSHGQALWGIVTAAGGRRDVLPCSAHTSAPACYKVESVVLLGAQRWAIGCCDSWRK